jgi:broad specificity phosphatase PhoE
MLPAAAGSTFISEIARMLYLVRHGQTQWNEQKRLQGSSDSPLTAAGIEQARNVGRALKSLIGDVTTWTLEASPLPRARISAEIIRGELAQSADIVLDERLREVSLGSWEGLTEEESTLDGQKPALGCRSGGLGLLTARMARV